MTTPFAIKIKATEIEYDEETLDLQKQAFSMRAAAKGRLTRLITKMAKLPPLDTMVSQQAFHMKECLADMKDKVAMVTEWHNKYISYFTEKEVANENSDLYLDQVEEEYNFSKAGNPGSSRQV